MRTVQDWRRWLIALAVSAALCAGACTQPTPEEVESEAVVPVRIATAEKGTIRGVVHATGLVTPAPGAELIVIAPEAARIAEIHLGEGERVKRGDVLVRFEILSGVSASDQVIVEGQATVASGAGSWSWRRTPASARARRSRWTRFVHSRDAARDPRPLRCDHSGTSAAALESLNLALVLLCSTARGKRPEITPATGAWIGFARIETVLTRLELADH
jgi:hypothetical protein